MSLGRSSLVLPSALEHLRGVLGVEDVVPPAEAARVVANELLVVQVMVVGTGPEGQEVVETPGEFVATVGVDGLEQTQHDPDVHGENVQISGEGAPDDGGSHRTEAENHDLNGRSVFSGQTEGCGVLVVDLVNGLVEGTPVEGTVGEVVPGVFHHEEDGDLVCHGVEGGEGGGGLETEELGHGVEEPAGSISAAEQNEPREKPETTYQI